MPSPTKTKTSKKKITRTEDKELSKVKSPKSREEAMTMLKEIASSIASIIDQIEKLSEEQIDFVILELIRRHPQITFDNICMTVAHEAILLKKGLDETKKLLFANLDKGITDIYNGTIANLEEEEEGAIAEEKGYDNANS